MTQLEKGLPLKLEVVGSIPALGYFSDPPNTVAVVTIIGVTIQ